MVGRCMAILVGGMLFAQGLTPESLLLGRIRYHMLETLRQIPNYTCLETIERTIRRPNSKKTVLIDALRLEVAVVDGKELFSWPGERQFQERDLRELAPSGAIGNGNFALHAKSVFGGLNVVFTYRGREVLENGREAVRYDYTVPLQFSGYQIRVGNAAAVVKYHGSILADARTLDLITLVVTADEDLPAELLLDRTMDTMHYARQRIGEGEFLLPVASEMVMVDRHGGENRNRVTFAGCRQYAGESTLRFSENEETEEPAPGVPAPVPGELPKDLWISVALDEAYPLEHAATGDLLTFTVRGDVRQKGRVIVPKEAKVRMRVSAVVQKPGGGFTARFALQPVEVEFNGHAFPIRAIIEESGLLAVRGQYRLDPAWRERPAMIYVRASPPQVPRGFILQLRTAR